MARSAEAQARQEARTRGYVRSIVDRDTNRVRALMRPDGLQPVAASVFSRPDRTIAVTEASNNLPGNRAGQPTLPDTRDRLRDNSRARDLKVTDKDGNVTYDARDRKRKVVRCDNTDGCLCVACIAGRVADRHAAEEQRRRNVAYATGRGWA
jgi:hypothetical protein